MPTDVSTEPVTHLVDPTKIEPIDVLGPTIAYLTAPDGARDRPCVMLGTIAPGGVVPLHGHADPETLLMRARANWRRWPCRPTPFAPIPVRAGDVVHVPGGARHASRNPSDETGVTINVGTARLVRFFGEIGVPVGRRGSTPGSPSDETLRRFLQTAERYGGWNATPEEDAAVGLRFG